MLAAGRIIVWFPCNPFASETRRCIPEEACARKGRPGPSSLKRRPKMRLIAFVLAALIVSGPAAAEWKELSSVAEGFGVVFPADPDVEEVAMFEVIPGKMVPARIYSARYDNSLFKMTVADGRDVGLLETPVIDQALK